MPSLPTNPLPDLQIIALPDSQGRIDEQWLVNIRRSECVQAIGWIDAVGKAGISGPLKVDTSALWRLAMDLGEHGGVLYLRSGLQLPVFWRERLASVDRRIDQPVVLAGNHDDAINPFDASELTLSPVQADTLLWLCSEHSLTAVLQFPIDCVFFRPGTPSPGDTLAGLLLDSIFVVDPDRPLTRPVGGPDQWAANDCAAALGPVRLRLSRICRDLDPSARLGPVGLDGRTVTLHVTHDWGGGISHWIKDVVDSDTSGHHLVLAASGDKSGQIHGQVLRLFAAGPGEACIREFVMTPAIADSVITDQRYREALDSIISRFGIGRIVISSLIGHALDAMETGLPTLLILHDFYPAWPLLHIDPLLFIDQDRPDGLKLALQQHGQGTPFSNRAPYHWQELGESWLHKIRENKLALIAPSQHVLERWRALTDDDLAGASIVGHGFRGWDGGRRQIAGRARADGRLNLVVLGRLSKGKGRDLLAATQAQIEPWAHITLLGCGREGLRFLGQRGIDIIVDYSTEQLPKILTDIAPQATLFLSTTPETWSYTLSETRSLGIPPIATRLGSFIERIRDGKDGWLFDPNPESLVRCLEHLYRHQDLLGVAVSKLPREAALEPTIRRYWSIAPASFGAAIRPGLTGALQAGAGQWAWDLVSASRDLEALRERESQLHLDLESRTQWAIRYERLAGDRTQWGKSLEQELSIQRQRLEEMTKEFVDRTEWAQSLDYEIRANRQVIDRLQAQLEERTRWAESLDAEVHAHRALIEQLQQELAERTQWAQTLDRELLRERARIERLDAEALALKQHIDQLETALTTAQAQSDRARHELGHLRSSLNASEHREGQLRTDLELLRNSRSWRWTRPLRFGNRLLAQFRRRRAWNPLFWPRLLRRLLHSLRFHGWRQTLQLAQGGMPDHGERPEILPIAAPVEGDRPEPVYFDQSDSPRASIVIPVYNKLAYTAACLQSIAEQAGGQSFEVIVVDDCSSDATAAFLAECTGLELVSNKVNSGFIASCNAGAARASGEYLVFLNNDTTVTEGWLEALLQTFDDFDQVGIAGARLIYPDGRLQEAGGIIFSDASGWNYGRNESPAAPQYNFAAEADYVSGACLAIPRALFVALDGFDRHYAPAYYEDTDLCFRIRQQGLRVFCQPACTIVHHEGVSSGTDETSGTKRYQIINRDKFRARWAAALALQPPHRIDSDRADPVRRARFHRARGRALFIDATTPMPDHDSGSVRYTAMLELMVEAGWQVSFLPQNLTWEGRYSQALQRRGVEVLFAPEFTSAESWLKQYGGDLDLVLVSRHYVLEPLLGLIRKHCPQARLVFDTVDLHFLREQRQAELSGSKSMASAAERTRRIELQLMHDCDITLVVSPVEQSLLSELVPGADVRVLSNIHSVHGCRQEWQQRRDLMFVGGFQHPPNVDAAEWLIDDIFPRIQAELPGVRLHLIGSRMPEALRSKARDGVLIHGFVEDLEPYLSGCRLSLAPLRYGAGVKGKVNQAMAWGLPVVATRCAAEGMFLEHGQDVLMADDSQAFAAEVVRAYTDESLWLKLSNGGLANVETHFSRAAAGRVIAELLDPVPDSPDI